MKKRKESGGKEKDGKKSARNDMKDTNLALQFLYVSDQRFERIHGYRYLLLVNSVTEIEYLKV